MAFRMLALWEYGRTIKILMWTTFPVTAVAAFVSIGLAIKRIFSTYYCKHFANRLSDSWYTLLQQVRIEYM